MRVTETKEIDLKEEIEKLKGEISNLKQQVEQSKSAQKENLEHKIITNFTDAIFLVEKSTTKILDCNNTAIKIFGYPKSDILGRSPEFLHVDHQHFEVFRKQLSETFAQSDNLQYFEFEMKRSDDEVFPTEHTVFVINDNNNNEIWVSFIKDISYKRKLEKELQEKSKVFAETEQKYKTIFDNSPIGIGLGNFNGDVIDANQKALEIFGYEKEELLSKKTFDLYSNPDQRKDFHNQIKKNGYARQTNVELLNKKGEMVYANISSCLIKNSNQEFMLSMIEDITARKRSEDEIINNRNKLKSIIESMDDLILIHDKDDRYLEYYQGGNKKELYRPFDEIKGKKFTEVLPKYLSDIVSEKFEQCKATGNAQEFDYQLEIKEEMQWFNAKISLRKDKEGNFDGITAVVRNTTDKKKILENLENSQQRYKGLVESSPDGILVVDENRNIVIVNKKLEAMFGYKREELLGKAMHKLLPSRYLEIHKRHEEKYLKKPKAMPMSPQNELFGKRKDGSEFPVDVSLSPSTNLDGKLLITASIKDVTDRKLIESRIKESEAKHRALIETSPDGILIVDRNQKIVFANEITIKLIGVDTIDEVLGTNVIDLVHKNDRKRAIDEFKKSAKNDRRPSRQYRINNKSSNEQYIEINSSLIYDAKDKPYGLIVVARDITERVKTEHELKRYGEKLEEMVIDATKELKISEEKFRALAENSEDTIMRFDRECRHLYANPIIEKQTGIKADNFLGKTHEELGFPIGLTKLWEQAILKVFRTKKLNRIEFQLPSGIWIDWVLIPEFDEDHEVNTVITSGREITKRKVYEKRLEDSLEKEQEINELKSQFISMVSHEFRTPLSAILSSFEIIKLYNDEITKDKRKILFNKVKKSIDHLTSMLDDVTELSRDDSASIKIEKEKFDLAMLIDNIIEEELYRNQKLISIFFDRGELIINHDEKIFRQIFSNLVSNAIKYTPEDKNIEIKLENNGQFIKFTIRDEGIGIPNINKNNLFEVFSRGSNVGNIQGSGLGLAITKKRIDLLKGQILFESEENIGTTFTVTLPL